MPDDAATITVTVSGTAAGGSASVPGSVSATVSSPNFSSNVTGPLTITMDRHAAVTWATPAAIPQGTALSSTQLDAVGNTAGTYVYTLNTTSGTVITSGTVLPAGANTLWVTFTPSDQESYPGTATASVTLTVNSATATASNPAPVNFGSEPVGSFHQPERDVYLHRRRFDRHAAGGNPGSHRTGLHRRRYRYLRHQRHQLRL